MLLSRKMVHCLLLLMMMLFSCAALADNAINIPILCYHNFNPTRPGSMNLTPQKFESQIKWIKENGFTVIPLTEAVAYLEGKRGELPAKSIVITVDDGWQSAYTYLLPIAKKYQIPMTLFIYPETISAGKNAMTWEELKKMQKTGLFDIQSHTYSHPNFKQEKRHRTPASYEQFVKMELGKSKKILEEKLGKQITLLAWPFGIYDDYLKQEADKAGYEMAFSIDARTANRSYKPMAQPRFMIIDAQSMKTFAAIVNGANNRTHIAAVK